MTDHLERSLSLRRGVSLQKQVSHGRTGQTGSRRRWFPAGLLAMGGAMVACVLLTAVAALEIGFWRSDEPTRRELQDEGRISVKHSCVHNQFMVPRIAAIQALRDANVAARLAVEKAAAARARKLLQTQDTEPVEAPIRIQPIYQLPATLDAGAVDFVKNVIIPNATRFFQRAVRVRQSVAGPLKLPLTCKSWWKTRDSTQCAQYTDLKCMDADVDPSHLASREVCNGNSCQTIEGGAGVNDADFVLYVTAIGTMGCSGYTVAHAGPCMFDTLTDRPVAGNVNFCPRYFRDLAKANNQSQLSIAIHELTHALVFSQSLFPYFRDDGGHPLVERSAGSERLLSQGSDATKIFQKFQERGRIVTKIVTPQVVARAREHFGCPTLNGAELEDGGGDGTAGAHWEARIFSGEIMEGVSDSNEQIYSPITLGLLEDSGWYRVNYGVGGFLLYGHNRGCDFAMGDCSLVPAPSAFQGYTCELGTRRCTADHKAVGICNGCTAADIAASKCLTDGCSHVNGYSNAFCPDVNSDTGVRMGQASGPGARCFEQGPEPWVADRNLLASTGAGCFMSRCDVDATGKSKLMVEVRRPTDGGEGVWVECVDNQMVALPRPTFSSGTLGPCPVAADFCPQINCPDDCNSQGTCYNGTCYCYPGLAGSTCDKVQCFPGQCPAGQVCDDVLGICKNPGPPSPPPPPRPPAPPRGAPPASGGKAIASAVVDSTIRFSGLSMDDTNFDAQEFQTHFRDAMSSAASAAAKSARFAGESWVSIYNIRRGSILSESLVQFAPAAGLTYSDAARAGNILQERITKDPASIFSPDPYFNSAGPIVADRSITYEGSAAPGKGNGSFNKASSFITNLFKKTWFIIVLAAIFGLTVLCCLYSWVKWCCGGKSTRY